MALMLFKYGLPLLLGYTLFVGISGRLNPLVRPAASDARASWFLALWTGGCVSAVLSLGLYTAYGRPLEQVTKFLPAALSLLAGLLVPALALYAYVRCSAAYAKRKSIQASFNWAMAEDEMQWAAELDGILPSPSTVDIALDATGKHPSPPMDNAMHEFCPAYLEIGRVDQMKRIPASEAVNDSSRSGDVIDAESVAEARSSDDITSHDAVSEEKRQRDAILQGRLKAEIALREQTEQHLRITRKALAVIEADTRCRSDDKADALIELEEQLAASIEQSVDAQRDAMKERTRRVESEQNIAQLKQKMVEAKQEIRRSAAARAKALGTANKSIAFARQSVQIRVRMEGELKRAQSTIENRQKTISSLIKALEKEKRKTQEEVTSVARQLVLHEKQVRARRTLEDVARSVENKLTSRLVKKVAKARPIASDINQG